MSGAIFFGCVFGLGALLVLTAQTRGRPQPNLASRLQALRPDRTDSPPEPKTRVFRTDVFEFGLRPALEIIGELLASAAKRFGFDLAETDTRLRLTGDAGGLTLFLGQKITASAIGFAFLPAASAISVVPATPAFMWYAAALTGFFLPDVMLRGRAEAQRQRLKEELAHFTDLVALAVSGGMGLESALDEALDASGNAFAAQLRGYLRESRLRNEPASSAIARMASDLRLTDAEPLAAALASAESQGTQLSQVLRVQAKSLRERRRVELIEAGEKAHTRMALPIGLLILPAFLIVILYPSAVQLLQVTR